MSWGNLDKSCPVFSFLFSRRWRSVVPFSDVSATPKWKGEQGQRWWRFRGPVVYEKHAAFSKLDAGTRRVIIHRLSCSLFPLRPPVSPTRSNRRTAITVENSVEWRLTCADESPDKSLPFSTDKKKKKERRRSSVFRCLSVFRRREENYCFGWDAGRGVQINGNENVGEISHWIRPVRINVLVSSCEIFSLLSFRIDGNGPSFSLDGTPESLLLALLADSA